jgi:GNAT superfamily N-acetyltransferase
MTIRPGCRGDVQEILSLMAVYYAEDGYPFDAVTAGRALLGLIDEDRLGRFWVVEEAHRLVGYLAVTFGYSLEYGGRDAFLDEVYLRPEARGRGAGRALLERAERACRGAGVRALHLEVEPARRPAHELYRRAGFVDQGRRLMTKRLPGPARRSE